MPAATLPSVGARRSSYAGMRSDTHGSHQPRAAARRSDEHARAHYSKPLTSREPQLSLSPVESNGATL